MQNSVTLPALALDTTGASCLLALALPSGEVVEKTITQTHGHASFLVPEVQGFLGAHGLELAALKTLLVVTGPGGFTGLRVGLSFARVLSKLTPINVLGVDAFMLHAAQPNVQFPTTILIDTRRNDSFAQDFDAEGTKQGEAYIKATPAPQTPISLAPVFKFQNFSGLDPVYIRAADTSEPKRPQGFCVVS